ncbi:MAG: hypothetical protein JWO20_807 [Candidatus Angelobacter sp.]|nr:hypothetical protein [Candidatus Angelobacter sp.]
MYPYESSPFTNVNPQSNPFQNFSAFQNPQGFQSQNPQGFQSQNPPGFQQNVSRFGPSSVGANVPPYQSAFAFQSPLAYSGYPSSQFQSPYQSTQPGLEYSSGRGSFLSPEEFAGSLGAGRFGSETRLANIGLLDPIFITELSRSARGLQDVAEQLEGIQPGQALRDDNQRKGIYAATAHLFYTFGLLASKGIFITGDMPGKLRSEVGGPANACREFGKQLERFVDKAATGRGITEELSRLVERGTACYAEITRSIEGSETGDQTARKKVAA